MKCMRPGTLYFFEDEWVFHLEKDMSSNRVTWSSGSLMFLSCVSANNPQYMWFEFLLNSGNVGYVLLHINDVRGFEDEPSISVIEEG
jgi:hypothetical protein